MNKTDEDACFGKTCVLSERDCRVLYKEHDGEFPGSRVVRAPSFLVWELRSHMLRSSQKINTRDIMKRYIVLGARE